MCVYSREIFRVFGFCFCFGRSNIVILDCNEDIIGRFIIFIDDVKLGGEGGSGTIEVRF